MGTLRKLLEKHGKRKAIVGLTAWDYPSGLLAQRAGGIDMVLVSDSLGKIVLGLPGSIGLSLDVSAHIQRLLRNSSSLGFSRCYVLSL